ncbi:MAG: pstC 3 [Candidatus Krumholzibacteriota bacterium]|nr:pstC 3 [Candidatus Krumholzibacteriota bacterium]
MSKPAGEKTQGQAQQTRRKLQTRRSVKIIDRVSTIGISIGGVGTIIAVLAVFLFLVSVVVPIFIPGSAEKVGRRDLAEIRSNPLSFGSDEYRVLGWVVSADGAVRAARLDTGEVVDERDLFTGKELTSHAASVEGGAVALGFGDGTVQTVRIGFVTDFPGIDTLPDSIRSLSPGRRAVYEGAVVEKTLEGQVRRQRMKIESRPPVAVDTTQSISLVDILAREDGMLVATLASDGTIRLSSLQDTEDMMTGEVTQTVTHSVLPAPAPGARANPAGAAAQGDPRVPPDPDRPVRIAILENGNDVAVIWRDGRLVRYDTKDRRSPIVAERMSLLGSRDTAVSAVGLLLGDATLLVGDTSGEVRAWFKHKPEYTETADGAALAPAHRFEGTGAPVTSIASSPRTRVVAVGYADGRLRLYQVTSGARILEVTADRGESVDLVDITAKNDGLVALTPRSLWHWDIDMRHPEATLRALFAPVWYEGYDRPAHVWQSSSGTDDFEPKFGLWPLVFGTLKATLYSMLFGAPIALLAAIFSSEFLAPSLRTRLKTIIEFMASLPSVVLGFLAALVFAPFVQDVVPATLAGFVAIPGTILAGAYVWQLLPQHFTLRFSHLRFVLLLGLLPFGVLIAAGAGPMIEGLFFLGDIRLWLDGKQGDPFGGWFLLALPLSALAVAAVMTGYLGPWFRKMATKMDRTRLGLLDAARFVTGTALVIAFALGAAWILQLVGLDPRGEGRFFGTYVQRNAMIVGFVMGFAIIPIIYTIAEDALSAVPEHLRAASLGAGATPWQTAFRIVIPTAMSGLFSALMIGLGRAVGETMIVLMAAGNTPILDINIFNGFRTLSANIAVELPEAVKGSTHFNTLFLAALILFAMTFVINTAAEIVRLRFRKRAYQL